MKKQLKINQKSMPERGRKKGCQNDGKRSQKGAKGEPEIRSKWPQGAKGEPKGRQKGQKAGKKACQKRGQKKDVKNQSFSKFRGRPGAMRVASKLANRATGITRPCRYRFHMAGSPEARARHI